jgi:hypothetical protein
VSLFYAKSIQAATEIKGEKTHFMKENRQTHISIKTKEVLVIRNGLTPPVICCPNCGVEVEILTPEQVAERALELSQQEGLVIVFSGDETPNQ